MVTGLARNAASPTSIYLAWCVPRILLSSLVSSYMAIHRLWSISISVLCCAVTVGTDRHRLSQTTSKRVLIASPRSGLTRRRQAPHYFALCAAVPTKRLVPAEQESEDWQARRRAVWTKEGAR